MVKASHVGPARSSCASRTARSTSFGALLLSVVVRQLMVVLFCLPFKSRSVLPSQVQITSSWLTSSLCSTALWRSSHASSRRWRFWLWLPRPASPPAPPVAFSDIHDEAERGGVAAVHGVGRPCSVPYISQALLAGVHRRAHGSSRRLFSHGSFRGLFSHGSMSLERSREVYPVARNAKYREAETRIRCRKNHRPAPPPAHSFWLLDLGDLGDSWHDSAALLPFSRTSPLVAQTGCHPLHEGLPQRGFHGNPGQRRGIAFEPHLNDGRCLPEGLRAGDSSRLSCPPPRP